MKSKIKLNLILNKNLIQYLKTIVLSINLKDNIKKYHQKKIQWDLALVKDFKKHNKKNGINLFLLIIKMLIKNLVLKVIQYLVLNIIL